jgi:hypothetical protein
VDWDTSQETAKEKESKEKKMPFWHIWQLRLLPQLLRQCSISGAAGYKVCFFTFSFLKASFI